MLLVYRLLWPPLLQSCGHCVINEGNSQLCVTTSVVTAYAGNCPYPRTHYDYAPLWNGECWGSRVFALPVLLLSHSQSGSLDPSATAIRSIRVPLITAADWVDWLTTKIPQSTGRNHREWLEWLRVPARDFGMAIDVKNEDWSSFNV